MAEVEHVSLDALTARLDEVESYLHIDEKREEIASLTQISAKADFWNDADFARQTMARLASLKDDVAGIDAAHTKLEDAKAALELGSETEDAGLLAESEHLADSLACDLSELELSSWFTDELDHGDAIVTVKPGQGGLEAQDWADMLFHMYLRYAARRGWSVDIAEATPAEVIGIDRATFTVSGKNAYGMLRAEQGVHRLVRISPTDDKKRRQTSFAGVEVLPVLPAEIEVDIDPGDLRIDVYHASGPGGQGVNTTDSAVRLTHMPTGLVVTCQDEKSQIKNKEKAFKVLKSRLFDLMQQEQNDKIAAERKSQIGSGDRSERIRTYNFPQSRITDHRINLTLYKLDSFLDGDLDEVIDALITEDQAEKMRDF